MNLIQKMGEIPSKILVVLAMIVFMAIGCYMGLGAVYDGSLSLPVMLIVSFLLIMGWNIFKQPDVPQFSTIGIVAFIAGYSWNIVLLMGSVWIAVAYVVYSFIVLFFMCFISVEHALEK